MPEKTDHDPADDNDPTDIPVKFLLTVAEVDYIARLVSTDQTRMIHNADHARSHGERNYREPEAAELALRIMHSVGMARSSAVITALEKMR